MAQFNLPARLKQWITQVTSRSSTLQLTHEVTQGRWLNGTVRDEHGHIQSWRWVIPQLNYSLYVPATGATALRGLFVMIHGCRQDASDFAQATRMTRIADAEGVALLFPEQTVLANSHRCWNWFEERTRAGRGEAALVLNMIDEVLPSLNVNKERVVLAGLSSGASLALLLALRYPERFAGVVSHSGVLPLAVTDVHTAMEVMKHGASLDLEATARGYWRDHPLPPPPLLVIHGDADERVHPSNADTLFELWHRIYACETQVTLSVERYEAIPGESRAVQMKRLYAGRLLFAEQASVRGMGHGWSGGNAAKSYTDPLDPNASLCVADFARRVSADCISVAKALS